MLEFPGQPSAVLAAVPAATEAAAAAAGAAAQAAQAGAPHVAAAAAAAAQAAARAAAAAAAILAALTVREGQPLLAGVPVQPADPVQQRPSDSSELWRQPSSVLQGGRQS